MRTRALALTLALAVVPTAPVATAAEFSSLEERMSAEEFRAAGLGKLSAEELSALNAWLRGEVARSAPAPLYRGPEPGFEGFGGSGDAFQARILGEFRGWSGNTLFRLDNGQIWKQVGGGTLAGVRLEDPVVYLEPGVLGAWYLKVDGYNKRARVERIK
ncbi:MAG TPA: hypothetical protein VFG21_10015 [Xanthomonadaceae bacterium]|nr:hypothetical protein [Xanthomonadaceae bacterium]